MSIIMMNQEQNLVDDNDDVPGPYFIFALNIEGDHEGGFASRVIRELGVEKFGKTGVLKWGEVVIVEGPNGYYHGIACYSLGYEGWDNVGSALETGLDTIYQKYQWGDYDWNERPYATVQLPGGDKVGKMQGADPFESQAAFAKHQGKYIILNG